MAYIANTPDDTRVMFSAIGLDTLEQLFDMIPPDFGSSARSRFPPALTELELTDHISAMLARNQGADRRVCFLGGGSYDHFIPAVVDNLAARGEFYTAYTPYQAEASQGTLQATFEYQTLMTQLTGLDVSNASLYDGGSAAAEAMLMALAITRRFGQVVVAESVHPEYRQILSTFLAHLEPKLVTVPATARPGHRPSRSPRWSPTRPPPSWSSTPTSSASSRMCGRSSQAAHAKGALAIVIVDPISLGLLQPPGLTTGPTSSWPRASRWAILWPTADRTWASWRAARNTSARCRGGSSARRPIATASGAGCSRSRPASSTSGARRRPRTSAPTRACWRCERASIWP